MLMQICGHSTRDEIAVEDSGLGNWVTENLAWVNKQIVWLDKNPAYACVIENENSVAVHRDSGGNIAVISYGYPVQEERVILGLLFEETHRRELYDADDCRSAIIRNISNSD